MTDAPSGSVAAGSAADGTALILGGSIAGLLTAAALSPTARRVVLVERDDLHALNSDPDATRCGAPQGSQVHALLAAGQRAMETLLPGIGAEFVAAGGALVDAPLQVAIFGAHGWAGRVPSEANVVFIRRPELERVVRRRVLALPNVEVVHAVATGLVADAGRITGVCLQDAASMTGDLLVDATGRSSKAVAWLAEHGYATPATKELRSYVGYATATVRLPAGVFPPGVVGVISHPHPGALRGAAVVPCDNGLFQIAALGMMRADPPKDPEGFLAHLAAAPSPLIAEIARRCEFVEAPTLYKVRGSLRRMWEEFDTHPDGILAIGDAVMSFNPLYGQGMSVAASEALTLREVVAGGPLAAPGLAARAQAAFTEVVDTVFALVVSVDAHYAGAEFDGVTPPAPEAVAFGRALSQLATHDPQVSLALKYAGHYFDTSALRAPEIAAKVRAWIASGAEVTHNDPLTIPPALDATGAPA